MNRTARELNPAVGVSDGPTRSFVGRFVPVFILALGIGAFFGFRLDRFVTFEALRENRALLMDFVHAQEARSIVLFVLTYAVSTAFSLPGAAVLTIAGGFLFGAWLGTAYAVVGATTGAIVVFLIAKTAFGNALRAKAGSAFEKMEAGFQENALSYLLLLRLMPIFPFFLVNIVPALLGVSLRTYAIGTFVGIIPGAFVFASVGAGLGSIFDMEEDFSPGAALTPEIIMALVGLSLIALLPVVYKKVKGRRRAG